MAKIKPMPWFRLHAEFATDPKVQSMDEPLQRRFVMLLCLQCNASLPDLDADELAFALRIDQETLERTKQVFLRKGFINENWQLTNWDWRQYKSDLSTERSRAYRARQKEQQLCNGDATLQQRFPSVQNTEVQNTDIKEPPPAARAPPLAADGSNEGVKIDLADKPPAQKAAPAKPKKTRIPVGYQLTDRMRSNANEYWARMNRYDLDADIEFEQFYAHYDDRPEVTRADWEKTWCTWYQRAVKFNQRKNYGQSKQPDRPGSPVERLIAKRKERERLSNGCVYENETDTEPAPH